MSVASDVLELTVTPAALRAGGMKNREHNAIPNAVSANNAPSGWRGNGQTFVLVSGVMIFLVMSLWCGEKESAGMCLI
jgi:hypothetical protein